MISRIFSIFFLLIIVVLGVTFALLNDGVVVLNYYTGSEELPVSLLIIVCLSVGVVLGVFVSLFPMFRLKRHSWQLKKRVKQLEQEVQNLRSLPIKD